VWLLPHQEEAVRRASGILARFGGVLIADAVGLGKTYVALALAALERARGGEALAVVPAALRGEWERAMAGTGVQVPLVSHTTLRPGRTDVPPASLLLVDEAHAFRNPRTRRYDALARLVVGRRIALLTATPFNNAPADVAALIALFAGRDRFRGLGVPDIVAALASPDGRAAQLALGAVSVCRTRRLVERRWPDLAASFPRRQLEPAVRYDLDAVYAGRLRDLLDALEVLARITRDADDAAALIHLGLLRRLESSPAALAASLRRHRAFAEDAVEAARGGRRLTRREFGRAHRRRLPEDQLLLWDLFLAPSDGAGDVLTPFLSAVRDVEHLLVGVPEAGDAKVASLCRLLDRLAPPAIVFTEHRATALALMRALRRHRRVLTVTGPDAWAGGDRIRRTEALDAFAPRARGRRTDPLLAADVLIATDVASEGMNLQDAGLVVNYDLPWNPVRIMQRVGRVDRLGSPHERVHLASMVPSHGIDGLTGTLRRLRDKLERGARAPTAEPDPLAPLWWLDAGVTPASVDAEAWRRVAPFEAWECWHALLDDADDDHPPLVAGVLVPDGESAVGLLVTVEWAGHAPVPLPFVMRPGHAIAEDAVGLAALADRAQRGRSVPVEPGMLTDALAMVLPFARGRAAELHAAWCGAVPPAPGRRVARAVLDRAVLRARHDRADTTELEEAAALLLHDVPEGIERLLRDHMRTTPPASDVAALVMRLLRREGERPRETPARPRLAFAAAVVVTAHCPARE